MTKLTPLGFSSNRITELETRLCWPSYSQSFNEASSCILIKLILLWPITVDLHKIEKRAALFITNKYSNTYSMTEICDSINWVTLKDRREERLCLMYKIVLVNGFIAVDMNDYLMKGDARTQAHDLNLQQITVNTTGYQQSFFSNTIPIVEQST